MCVPPSRAPGSRHAWISISRKRSSHASLRAERKFAADAVMTRQGWRPSNCSKLLQRYMRRTWPLFSSPSSRPYREARDVLRVVLNARHQASIRLNDHETHPSAAPVLLLWKSSRHWRVFEEAVEVAGEVALEAAGFFAAGLAVGASACDVVDRWLVPAAACDEDHVSGAVELSVA